MGRPPSDVGAMLKQAFIEHEELHAYGARRLVNLVRREQGRRPLSGNYFHLLFVVAERDGLIDYVRDEPASRETASGDVISLPDLPARKVYAMLPGARKSRLWFDLPARLAAGKV